MRKLRVQASPLSACKSFPPMEKPTLGSAFFLGDEI
jgi:hypothetical protein